MALRTLPVLLVSLATCMFAQDPTSLKAGDPAPDLSVTKTVAHPGHFTVLLLLRPVSHNAETVTRWNNMVEHFSGQPIDFVWIANEKHDSLDPFLKDHPILGSLVLDPAEESYKAYGEGATGVYIDPYGTIIGFSSFPEQTEQVQAVLDGRAIAVDGQPTEEQLDTFFDGSAVRLEARPHRTPPPLPPKKPDVPPSDELHITPSNADGTISSSGPDYWMRRGFELKAILAEISGVGPTRVELPAALDTGARYDFVLVPPHEEDTETINRLVRDGIAKHFHVSIASETRSMDAYVITAIQGKTPRPKPEDEAMGGSIGTSWQAIAVPEAFRLPQGAKPTRKQAEEAAKRMMGSPEFRQAMAMAQLTGMSAVSSSMDDFRRALEDGLHRPVIDETGLDGYYDFKLAGEAHSTDEFLRMLREQLGLVVTSARRSIAMIVARPLQ